MARGTLSENERYCLEGGAKNQPERLQDAEKTINDCKSNGLRVRFLDEEGKTERTVSADSVDCAVSRVKKIHILKNRSSSETSILLRNPSLLKRRLTLERRYSDGQTDTLNNNSQSENLNGKSGNTESSDKTDYGADQTKESQIYKKNCNVYSVNQAKTLTPERKKSIPLTIPKLIAHRENVQGRSILPNEVCLADGASGKDFTARAIGRLSRGLGRLLRRTNSVRISEPDPVYKVAYLGNVLTGWARGESCIEKPLATLWRNYQQSTKPDVVMKLSVTNSGLKGFTKEHGLTEYWSHRITYCASPPHYPKLFCWVYRHEGKKLKHELRCHAVLCTKETVSKKITEELQIKLKQALVEFKKDRISKQNARLSLANSVYDNPSMPRRKILLSVGAMNYRPPLERSKSAPKLGAIEELCSEEDEEEAEMNSKKECQFTMGLTTSQSLDRRRQEIKSPRKLSCPEGVMDRMRLDSEESKEESTDKLIDLLVHESKLNKESESHSETSQENNEKEESRLITLESIEETIELNDAAMFQGRKKLIVAQSNYLVTDSDDGSVSSGCETASTVTSSDAEPSSLPSHFSQEEHKETDSDEERVPVFERIRNFESASMRNHMSYTNSIHAINEGSDSTSTVTSDEVSHVPIGEKNAFRRRSTYPPLRADSGILDSFEGKFDTLIDNLTDVDSLNSSTETEVFKNTGDNDSACSDESGYSELLDGKESIIGNTIMV
ncbi:uncharacterized protein LOC113392758 [Vanessa tameamea]|uniref:Uncharacterized protein LOC113392758 n=1 Tax=Vanessa tameamea TaxID=334116 RepID=A0A8B8HJU0_VANTA